MNTSILKVDGIPTALIDSWQAMFPEPRQRWVDDLALLPDARLHVLSGCGHWTMIEKTAEFLAVVRPFLTIP
jgi:2-hydroxymuconate-semialdehyde hydrolase